VLEKVYCRRLVTESTTERSVGIAANRKIHQTPPANTAASRKRKPATALGATRVFMPPNAALER
jgi:hypothetical protein